ncbi:MAG: hypothetical protein ACRCZJ_06720 [Erysipelotrichaceae bacterium]
MKQYDIQDYVLFRCKITAKKRNIFIAKLANKTVRIHQNESSRHFRVGNDISVYAIKKTSLFGSITLYPIGFEDYITRLEVETTSKST